MGAVAGTTSLSCSGVGEEVGRAGRRASDGRGTDPRQTGDDALLGEARDDLVALERLVVATRRRHRSLRGRLAGLLRTHRDQLGVLDPDGLGAVPGRPSGPGRGIPEDPAAALAGLLREEERLQRRMVTWAVAVDSGPLARLLAATAAGVAQQVAVLARGQVGEGSSTGSAGPRAGGAGGAGSVDALQRVLASEHAAVWVLGSLGAATSMSAAPDLFERLSRAHEAHRTRRDRLAALLLDRGTPPVGSEVAYAVPGELGSPTRVAEAAARVERSSSTAWSFLVASSTGATRRWAAQELSGTALSGLGLGGPPEALPGAADLLTVAASSS